MNTTKHKDYIYIRRWGQMMGSYDDYIENQVARANETNAPDRAIYEITSPGGDKTGKWRTVDDIDNPETKALMEGGD